MRTFLIGIAAVALAASPTFAQGNGKGNGNGGNGGGNGRGGEAAGSAQVAPRGNGNGNGGGGGQQAQRPDRGNGNGNGNGNGGGQVAQAGGPETRGSGNGGQNRAEQVQVQRAERGNERRAQNAETRPRNDRAMASDSDRDRTLVVERRDERFGDGDWREALALNSGRVIDGCPPGLAKKNPPCVPPGQVGRSGWMDADNYRPDWWGLSGYGDGRYLYDDGYLMRLGDNGRVGGFIPLLAGALGVGNAWPSFYQPAPLPSYYESFYGLGPSSGYRYADDVIYRVDPTTSAITSIAALLTGDQFSVGQPLPLGYDAYNVPYAHRDQYSDTPDSLYRYSDGYVYQVDPETRLIAAAIELLAS